MALSIVAAVSMSPGFRIMATTSGLDPSWVYGFNYASAHGMRWGRDFISTYGPYGYVLLTMDVGDLVMRKIAFTFFLAALAINGLEEFGICREAALESVS